MIGMHSGHRVGSVLGMCWVVEPSSWRCVFLGCVSASTGLFVYISVAALVQEIRQRRETREAARLTMATVGDFTDAERAMAQRRLKTWIPQVDPANRAHVDAYLLTKMKNARVSVQQVLQIIQEQELSVSSS